MLNQVLNWNITSLVTNAPDFTMFILNIWYNVYGTIRLLSFYYISLFLHQVKFWKILSIYILYFRKIKISLCVVKFGEIGWPIIQIHIFPPHE